MLIRAINELARGNVSVDTVAFLKSLEGHLPLPAKEKRVLFSTNDAVDIYNTQQLLNIAGKLFTYSSKDEGLKGNLAKLQVPQVCSITTVLV